MKAIPNLQDHWTADAKKCLEERISKIDDIKAVFIVSLKKDGTLSFNRSLSTKEEFCFAKCYFDAIMVDKFQLGDQ